MSRKTTILSLCGALAVIVIASLAIGRYGQVHEHQANEINWELAGIVGTALGTTFLAFATGFLGFLTWRDVSATQDLAELTRKDQRIRNAPYLVFDQPVAGRIWSADEQRLCKVDINLENVGLGPALRVNVYGRLSDEAKNAGVTAGGAQCHAIGPDTNRQMEIIVVFPDRCEVDPVDAMRDFILLGTWEDRAGNKDYEFWSAVLTEFD